MALTVAAAAEEVGVTVATLHHYDDLGLVVPRRNGAGHRRYDPESMHRLRVVVTLKRAHFQLDEIRVLLEGQQHWLELAHTQLDRLQQEIDAARRAQTLVTALLECGCGSLLECRRLEAPARHTVRAAETLHGE